MQPEELSRCQKGTGTQGTPDRANTKRKYTKGRSRDKLLRKNIMALPELAGIEFGNPSLHWS